MKDTIGEIIADIDIELNRPPLTIEESIGHAIKNGTMTAQEGYDCLCAYEKTLNA